MSTAVLARFNQERKQAFTEKDPMASLLALATVNSEGLADVRTLVLRDIEDQLAIFINRTSPKWLALQSQPLLSFMTYWPSKQLQYRFQCQTRSIDKAIVDASWLLRPDSPKRMDHLYESGLAQSGPISSRAELLDRSALLDDGLLTHPAAEAAGLYLLPTAIERLDLNMQGEPHDRRRYRQENDWAEEVLMP
ncbi:MAG: pyridoxamine 5'-phosphate oxidase family protein [Pseudomonadales bacterium]